MSRHRARYALCTIAAVSIATTLILAAPASAQSRNSRSGRDAQNNRGDDFNWKLEYSRNLARVLRGNRGDNRSPENAVRRESFQIGLNARTAAGI